MGDLTQVGPLMLATYREHHPGSLTTVNPHFSTSRKLFAWYVEKKTLLSNPAREVRAETIKCGEGKCPYWRGGAGEQAVSHDAISDCLRREKITPCRLWEIVALLLTENVDSYLVVDDSVQDKRYGKKNGLIKSQHSGASTARVRR